MATRKETLQALSNYADSLVAAYKAELTRVTELVETDGLPARASIHELLTDLAVHGRQAQNLLREAATKSLTVPQLNQLIAERTEQARLTGDVASRHFYEDVAQVVRKLQG